jgi:hypothetical protein
VHASRRLGVLATLAVGLLAVFVIAASAASTPTLAPHEVQPSIEKEVNRDVPNSQSNAHVPSSHVPRPDTVGVDTPSITGGEGLNHYDQRNADDGSQFSLEPPDQGLCVGGGQVVEAVNDVLAIYNTSVQRQTDATSLTKFFTGESQIVRHEDGSATYGPFLSDPKCYYDPELGQFFMTILEIDQDSSTGDLGTHSSELIAVSKPGPATTNPADWYHYSIDTSNNGGSAADTADGSSPGTRSLPTHHGCPCFGDQPLIGADRYGFYVTSNEFSIAGPEFNGAQVYAMDKAALASGTLKLQYVAGEPPLGLAEGPAYSLQPATSPSEDDWSNDQGGTEYLLSALDFDATLDNRIALWALTNTSSLATDTPDVSLTNVVLDSEVYGQPPDAEQKDGPTPLAQVIQQIYGAKNPKSGASAKEELLAANDDRMNQTVYADGMIWGAVNTVVKTENGPTHVGSAYFGVTPSWSGDTLAGSVDEQGYVAVNQANLLFPSIAVSTNGDVVYTATLSGTDYFPSAVYATIESGGPSSVHVVGPGVGPDDGFTGYPPFGGPTGRWGDYSAAVPDADGNVWIATEYINQSCTLDEFLADPTCGGTRTTLANWSTFVGKVSP